MNSVSYAILGAILFIIITFGVACTLSIIQTDTGARSRADIKDTPTETISPELTLEE